MKIFFLMGAPGVGKSTQAALISNTWAKLGYKHIKVGVGESLRYLQKENNSFITKELEAVMNNGDLIPSIFPILITAKQFVEAVNDGIEYILFDGGIRKPIEAKLWLQAFDILPNIKAECIIINVDDLELNSRIIKRNREDDFKHKKRINIWNDKEKGTAASLKLLEKNANIKLKYIDGVGTAEEVFERIHKQII